MRLLVLVALLAAAAPALAAQPQAADTVRGRVVDPGGRPVRGANVFVAGSLDGTLTDSTGAFTLASVPRGASQIEVQAVGFPATRTGVAVPGTRFVVITLGPWVVRLEQVVVEAGEHAAGGERGSTLTSLEVVAIPGARGDLARAFQTLPGVQAVDEGTGMFVRGGESQETRVFLNGAALLDPQRVETPVGSTATTVDPFLLEGIFFSTGGFGARFGGALSAIADLRTTAVPSVGRRSTLHASLASVSGRTSHRVSQHLGLHATANVSDNRANFALNRPTRHYPVPPHGRTLSGSAAWSPRAGTQASVFAFSRSSAYRVVNEQAGFAGTAEQRTAHDLGIVSWFTRGRSTDLGGGASWQRFNKDEHFGTLDLESSHELAQGHLHSAHELAAGLTLRGGMDLEAQRAEFRGRLPSAVDRAEPSLPGRALAATVRLDRAGGWAEVEARPLPALRVRAGVRAEHSGWSGTGAAEPRLSATYLLPGGVLVLAAAGAYSQPPDPLLFALADSATRPRSPMRGKQVVAGIGAGSADRLVRLEVYHKTYDAVAQLDRAYRPATGGTGQSRGADLFALATLPGETAVRVVYSLVDAERTDPNTGRLARASTDITHTLLAVAERTFFDRLSVGAAYRAATGRPYTPVVDAAATGDGTWEPRYGEPYGARLPTFSRLDLSASLLHNLAPEALAVVYLSVQNVLGRQNVQRYAYTADYRERTPVHGQVGRGIFFGASLTF